MPQRALPDRQGLAISECGAALALHLCAAHGEETAQGHPQRHPLDASKRDVAHCHPQAGADTHADARAAVATMIILTYKDGPWPRLPRRRFPNRHRHRSSYLHRH